MSNQSEAIETVAEAYLSLLASRGVDYIFGNAGTDFPPIIEAYAKARYTNFRFPEPIVVPHENVAVAMAHGYYMATGRIQAVMVHVGLGTANALNGIINAARLNIPMLMTAGRTPILEQGAAGARNNYINWAQEMFDQAGMVREFVKWDYELRHPLQLETVVDRALALATSEPKGPVYLTLPREVLAGSIDGACWQNSATMSATGAPTANSGALEGAAARLKASKRPLIITSNVGVDLASFDALAQFALNHAIPVVQYRPRYLCLATDHPMHCGYDPTALLKDADFVLVLDCDVPWLPELSRPLQECCIVQAAPDPQFGRYPIRGFRSDYSLGGDISATIAMLEQNSRPGEAILAHRRMRAAAHRTQKKPRSTSAPKVMTQQWISECIDAAKKADTVVINEYPLSLEAMTLTKSGTYFSHSPAGGLGWSMGAGLGFKLAKPDSEVIVAVGDGTYMFGNPTPAHLVGRASDLPILYVIFNNSRWAAVHRATLSMYPDGYAAREEKPPFSCLEPAPDFEKIVEASGGYGEKVEDPAELPAALARALHAVRVEGRQAVLNVICEAVYVRTS